MADLHDVRVLGVPFDGYGRPGNHARAASALLDAGIADAAGAGEIRMLRLPGGDPSRGRATALVNESALESMADAVGDAVLDAVEEGAFPLVVGGDCTTLLGTIPTFHGDGGPVGLVFVDGHEDTMPLDVSEDGEAANAELGLLLGLTGRTLDGPLARVVGALDRDHLAVLGPRDDAWRRRFLVGSLRDLGVHVRDVEEIVADPHGVADRAVAHVRASIDRWWLHTDLDVLDRRALPAQGLPGEEGTPGGLSIDVLATLLARAVRDDGCVGWSVALYDPDQDPDGASAALVVDLVRRVLQREPATAAPT